MFKKLGFIITIILGCFIGAILYKIAEDNEKKISLKKKPFNINMILNPQAINQYTNEEEVKKENLKDYILYKWFSIINTIVENINFYLSSFYSDIKPYISF
ncbi:MAG: putative secreted protein [Candidatus Phytoplasma cynodontis]|uniref:hypothetical protein n=1 Tax='Cynodon dactylon' phytoplasma TaxID=295320 RepID=UPI001265B7CF|nr:hypothetical protein ['Cynodon dactylon' phytoplasma]KAB8121740.1 hypothetical protein F1741_01720 ['Cynodon dactylon' phytoplasma]WIA07766.1 MAG: putative secreted protein [Candidatus Phytoplasma cynodontis]